MHDKQVLCIAGYYLKTRKLVPRQPAFLILNSLGRS